MPSATAVSRQQLLEALPAELQSLGMNRYYGNKGVKRARLAIAGVSDASTVEFLSSALPRLATGFYAETESYGVPEQLLDTPCNIGLGPVVVVGVCGRAKRAFEMTGHGRMRDELARALVCCREG